MRSFAEVDGFGAVIGFADYFELVTPLKNGLNPVPKDLVVVNQKDLVRHIVLNSMRAVRPPAVGFAINNNY